MTWRRDRLPEIVRAMAGRPRHEALRGHVTELLREGFGAPYDEIAHEVYLLDISGRIDTMWGATVIELKSDLRREQGDVEVRMPDYLADAARRSANPRPVTGIATDGATFIGYQLVDAALCELHRYSTDPERPDELMAWLQPLLSDDAGLLPEARAVVQAFGRTSLTFNRARMTLEALWAALRHDPEVRLKRELWDGLLREAYGEDVGQDSLFLQHTYLTIVVKTIAARVLDLTVDDPGRLLSGGSLADEGILGAVEADFFDWPLKQASGADLVRQVAVQTARFRLVDVQTDVLKVLYESLVDPDERHDLGEYYTPDWLAGRVVAEAVEQPLTQRVLDPACGSGTFLFHALRRLVAAGREAGWSERRIVASCAEQVRGLDVHPVAVTLARVTWLLALGPMLASRPPRLTVPVFLGDAMQWNLRRFVDRTDVAIDVPGEARPLRIPLGFAEQQVAFESGLDELNRGLADDATPETVGRALRRIEGASVADADALAETFAHLQTLYRAGRNGIWTFVFRNLARPVWLSRPEQRADVLVSARINHMQNLGIQAGASHLRILYTKAGTRLSAAILRGNHTYIDHKAYWAPARSDEEAAFLAAILNSAAVLAKITDLQPHGQRDKRDFDNLVWTLPIPEYDDAEPVHRDLAAAALRAEWIAADADLAGARHFTAKRRAIRAALVADGVAAEIETLVDALLPP